MSSGGLFDWLVAAWNWLVDVVKTVINLVTDLVNKAIQYLWNFAKAWWKFATGNFDYGPGNYTLANINWNVDENYTKNSTVAISFADTSSTKIVCTTCYVSLQATVNCTLLFCVFCFVTCLSEFCVTVGKPAVDLDQTFSCLWLRFSDSLHISFFQLKVLEAALFGAANINLNGTFQLVSSNRCHY
jgi:hypothetical protein